MTQPYSVASSPYLPDPVIYPPSIKLPLLKRGRVTFEAGVDTAKARVAQAVVTFGSQLSSMETQGSLLLPSACPSLYDGSRVHEAGFNFYPEAEFVADAGSGNLTALGTYSAVFVYEWTDARGKMTRSAPSVPVTRTLASGTGVTLRSSALFLTDKQGADIQSGSATDSDNRLAVKIACFRTVNGGTVFFRDSNVNATFADINSMSRGVGATGNSSDFFTIGGYSDTAIVANEILYTTGGALENQVFPSATVSCSHQRRIFMVKQDDQNVVRYTDEDDDRFLAVGTSEVYEIPIPVEGGSVVGLASMDEKLVILCQHRIYFIFGEGPNRLGQQNGYSLPQLCSAKLGALGGCHESIALTPEGLWFMSSARGLRLLTRGLQIAMEADGASYLGRESDGLLPDPVLEVRAVSIPAKSQVRWYLSGSNTVIVWDYQQQKWTRFTNHNSSGGAVSARGLAWHSDGAELYSSNEATGGLDDVTVTPQVYESAWLALADVQGFQRIYKLMLLGQAISASTLAVAVGYDYDETWIEAVTLATGVTSAALSKMRYALAAGSLNFGATVTGALSGATGVVAFNDTANTNLYFASVVGVFEEGEDLSAPASWTAQAGVFSSPVLLTSSASRTPVIGERVLGATSGAYSTILNVVAAGAGFTELSISAPVGTFSGGEVVYFQHIFNYAVTAANPLQLEHPMHRQQCEAVRFRITVTPGSTAEGVRLTNFGISVGLKKGTFKLASSKRF